MTPPTSLIFISYAMNADLKTPLYHSNVFL